MVSTECAKQLKPLDHLSALVVTTLKAVSGQKGLVKSQLFAACSIGYLPIKAKRLEWREL